MDTRCMVVPFYSLAVNIDDLADGKKEANIGKLHTLRVKLFYVAVKESILFFHDFNLAEATTKDSKGVVFTKGVGDR